MSRKLWFVALVALTLLISVVPAAATGARTGSAMTVDGGEAKNTVDDILRRQLQVEETARFVVVFANRPSLDTADGIADFSARGEYVVAALQTAAEESQERARELVAEHNGVATSFWFRNAMIVEGDEVLLDALAALPEVVEIGRSVSTRW